eukprot:15364577-Ditylum_brightwellii.AAC.1
MSWNQKAEISDIFRQCNFWFSFYNDGENTLKWTGRLEVESVAVRPVIRPGGSGQNWMLKAPCERGASQCSRIPTHLMMTGYKIVSGRHTKC